MARKRKGLVVAAILSLGILCGSTALAGTSPSNPEAGPEGKMVERGRYLVKIAGCNDCHTPRYLTLEGNVPEALWLTGSRFGWRGPWGTTYGANLRLFVGGMTAEQWVSAAHTLRARPTMPWYNLNAMTTEDLTGIYQFIRHLGPAGEPAPAYVPPDREPKTPYALFPAPPK